MSDNRVALYLFRARLPDWLERRARRAANAGNTALALRLCNLIASAERRSEETSPFEITPFSA